MKTILMIVIAGVSLVAPICAASDNALALTVVVSQTDPRAYRAPDYPVEGDGPYQYNFSVTLKNTGETMLTVPRNLKSSLHSFIIESVNGQESYRLYCSWDIPRLGEGWDIPAESELGLVKLRKGETTRVQIAVRTIENLDHHKITFIYEVKQALAERFGTWEGTIEAPVLDQKEVQQLRNQQTHLSGK